MVEQSQQTLVESIKSLTSEDRAAVIADLEELLILVEKRGGR